MSTTEAKEMLLTTVEEESRQEMAQRIREVEAQLKEESDQIAREIVSFAIQRCATDVASETTVSVVPLPSDDMKGRLIGREGRNIRTLEGATGVDLIVDDTPEAVTISCFDPIRREVARLALERLILDGRIHARRPDPHSHDYCSDQAQVHRRQILRCNLPLSFPGPGARTAHSRCGRSWMQGR